MKINVYTFDFETPRWLRKTIAYAAPIALVCGIGIAYADVPHHFQSGEVLKAADLEADFKNVDDRLGALEAPPPPEVVTAGGIAGKDGVFATDTVYDGAELTLAAGTWLVTGYATLQIAVNADGVGLGLYDQTHGQDIAGSAGPIYTLSPQTLNGGFETSHVITLASTTTLRLKAFRNGASTVSFEDFTNPGLAPLAALKPHKLKAVRLR
ncbi:MAG: hypothetical protein U0359_04895 [Byssovorax sp.]